MNEKKDGGPAFPEAKKSYIGIGQFGDTVTQYETVPGMTLRDYFAGYAEAAWIQVLAQRRHEPGYSDESAAEYAAHLAGISADAMLAEREK